MGHGAAINFIAFNSGGEIIASAAGCVLASIYALWRPFIPSWRGTSPWQGTFCVHSCPFASFFIPLVWHGAVVNFITFNSGGEIIASAAGCVFTSFHVFWSSYTGTLGDCVSGLVSLEHLLLSWYPSQRDQPTLGLSRPSLSFWCIEAAWEAHCWLWECFCENVLSTSQLAKKASSLDLYVCTHTRLHHFKKYCWSHPFGDLVK